VFAFLIQNETSIFRKYLPKINFESKQKALAKVGAFAFGSRKGITYPAPTP
jgi:hypothetical protein